MKSKEQVKDEVIVLLLKVVKNPSDFTNQQTISKVEGMLWAAGLDYV